MSNEVLYHGVASLYNLEQTSRQTHHHGWADSSLFLLRVLSVKALLLKQQIKTMPVPDISVQLSAVRDFANPLHARHAGVPIEKSRDLDRCFIQHMF